MDLTKSQWLHGILFYVTITTTLLQASSNISIAKSTRRPSLDNRKGTSRVLWNINQRGAPLCIAECSRDSKCSGAFYNKVTGQCQGHSVTYSNASVTVTEQNFRYYVQPFGVRYIGDACNVSADCSTLNSECRQGVCACFPGYSFSPRTHECKDCTIYGKDFMEIRDHYISGRNVETIAPIQLNECFEHCINATSYTCKSLEYGRSSYSCTLSNITVLDCPERWYADTNMTFNISYYQRDCAD